MAHRADGRMPTEVADIFEQVARRLEEVAHPEKVILFGSYSRGDFDDRSDLDLLVILPTVENRAEEMVRLRRALKGIPLPIDIVVYSASDVESRKNLRGTMLYHALREGRVLYDAA